MGAQRQVTPCMWFLMELAVVPQCGHREGTSTLHPGSVRMEATVVSQQLAQGLTARENRPMTACTQPMQKPVLQPPSSGWKGLTVACKENIYPG